MIETNLARFVSALSGRGDADALARARGGPLFALGLSTFYAVFGVRSDRLSESVMMVCQTVMRERFGPDDILLALEAEAALFRLAGMKDPEAVDRAVGLVADIAVKLLGEPYATSGSFHATLAAVDGAGVVGADKRLRHRGVEALLAYARTHAVPSAHPAVRFVDVRGSTAWIPEPGGTLSGWEIVGTPHANNDAVRQWSEIVSPTGPSTAGWERLIEGSRRERRLAREAGREPSDAVESARRNDGTA